jgi:anti-anti-sigma factor
VVVDLSAVTFIATLGIGLIVSTREELEKRGLTLKLANVPAAVEKTFKVMSLTEVFERV